MSQNSIVINDGTGVQVLSAINNALDTINTLHAGTTEPSELVVGMLWADTTASMLKRLASTGPAVWTTLGTLAANFGMLRIDGSNAMAGPLDEKSASPASAATLDVSGGNFLQPTGTTTISALGTAQVGASRCLYFTTALQLTDSANLILPGVNKNITTATGDVAEFRSLGGGIWLLTNYKRGDGGLTLVGSLDTSSIINEAMGADIVAATTTNLGTATGNTVRITNASGATVISALGTAQAGARRTAYFYITGGSVTLQHNATSLVCPGGQNISVTDGDAYEFVNLGGGNWRCTLVQRNSLSARIWTFVTKNSSYTVLPSDYGVYFVSIASTPDTFSLPAATTAGAGFVVGIRNKNTNSAMLTISANGSDTVEGVSTMNVGIGSSYVLICDGVNSWYRMDTGISPTSPQSFVNGSQVFGVGAAQTFTVPAGVFYIRVSLWSGGGGISSAATAGAGSGAYATGIYSVVAGQQYSITVGAGGINTGGTGGSSSFASLLSCTGGGGTSNTTQGTAGAASGSGTLLPGAVGDTAAQGGVGASAAGASGGAQTGALQNLGSAGAAAGVSVIGAIRESGGGGGNGGGDGAGGTPGAGAGGQGISGAAGGDGKCIVEW